MRTKLLVIGIILLLTACTKYDIQKADSLVPARIADSSLENICIDKCASFNLTYYELQGEVSLAGGQSGANAYNYECWCLKEGLPYSIGCIGYGAI